MPESIWFEYASPTIEYGTDAVLNLDDSIEAIGISTALLICGSTVGSTPAVMNPLRTGLEETLCRVFDETTPEKRLNTALDARAAYRTTDADGLVAVGGGSSLDVAKVTAALIAADRSREELIEYFREHGTVPVADEAVPPITVIPTTLAGADLSQMAGITRARAPSAGQTTQSGGVSNPALMPDLAVYDPALVATTPESVLTGSAMNGFNKGIETLYTSDPTPVTDATALRGIDRLASSLPTLTEAEVDAEVMAPILEGLILVQYGISRPQGSTLSIIHAFGHGLTAHSTIQQGIAHAIVTPHVLRYIFDTVDGRRGLLAQALSVDTQDDRGDAVIDRITSLRDELALPTRLRGVDGPPREAYPDVAETIVADSFMANAPPGLHPSQDEIIAVLEAAY